MTVAMMATNQGLVFSLLLVAPCQQRGLGAIVHVQFVEDVAQMCAYGVFRNV